MFNESRVLDRPEFTCVTIDHTATSLEEHQRTPKPPFFILKLIKILKTNPPYIQNKIRGEGGSA